MFIEQNIIAVKQLRKDTDVVIQATKALPPSEEVKTALRKFQEGVMWLGMELKRLGEAKDGVATTPYPNSRDTTNATVDPTADGLKL